VQARWEHFEHGADIGVRGIAPTKAGAFEQAALALTAVVVDPQRVRADEAVEVSCEAPDEELLLVDWLNALVYEMATRGLLFGRDLRFFVAEDRSDDLVDFLFDHAGFSGGIGDYERTSTRWNSQLKSRSHAPR